MTTKSKFEIASECAENWIDEVAFIAFLGERNSVDGAYSKLQTLHDELKEHGDIIDESSDKLQPLSDEQILWPKDRGWSKAIQGGKVSCWSSAHEAAVGLVRMALDLLYFPVLIDRGFDLSQKEKEPETRYYETPITDPDEQWKRAEHFLTRNWEALVIPDEKKASLKELIRRERAKLLVNPKEKINDSEWSVEKFKSDWRDILDIKPTQWRRDVNEGNLTIDPIGRQKRCRVSMECLRRIIGKDAEQYA